MYDPSENLSMRRKSFYFGNLALTGSWVLFVLALAAAAWVPSTMLPDGTILTSYALICTVLWAFYLISSLGSLVQSKYPDKPLKQWVILAFTVLLLALSLTYCVWVLPLLLIVLPLLLTLQRKKKSVFYGIIAGIGEFAALCNTALLFLLLKALISGEWDFAGIPLRCDVFLATCGVLSLAGIFVRHNMLTCSDPEWSLKKAICKPVFIVIWSVLIVSVIATIIANAVQEKILLAVKAEAEKTFNAELSADGLSNYYLDGQQPDVEFYKELDRLSRKINKAMRGKKSGRKFDKKAFVKPTAEQLAQREKAYAAVAGERAKLNLMLAKELPKYPVRFSGIKLTELKQPYSRSVRNASFALMMQFSREPGKIVELSQAYFRLFHALDRGTAFTIIQQNKMVKFWCESVKKLRKDKKISDAVYKELQALAKAQAGSIDIASRLKGLAYIEAVMAYDLYKTHGLTTTAATGAFFKYDRTEALRSFITFANTGKTVRPDRSIAKMLMPGLEVLESSLIEMQQLLNKF